MYRDQIAILLECKYLSHLRDDKAFSRVQTLLNNGIMDAVERWSGDGVDILYDNLTVMIIAQYLLDFFEIITLWLIVIQAVLKPATPERAPAISNPVPLIFIARLR